MQLGSLLSFTAFFESTTTNSNNRKKNQQILLEARAQYFFMWLLSIDARRLLEIKCVSVVINANNRILTVFSLKNSFPLVFKESASDLTYA